MNQRFLVPLLSVLLVFSALIWTPRLSAATEKVPSLEVTMKDGVVSLTAENTNLNEAQLVALRSGLARELNRTPFKRGGSLRLLLKGDRVEELEQRLNAIDINNSHAVDEVIADTWTDVTNPSSATAAAGGAEADSSRVLLGQNFSVEENEQLESLVVIGGSGSVKGDVGTLVAIGSTVDLASTARVHKDLVSLGSVIRKSPGAAITAQEVTVSLPSWSAFKFPTEWSRETNRPPTPLSFILLAWAASYLVVLGLGYLYLRLFPIFRERSETHLLEHKGASLGIGVLGHVLLIPGALFLVVSLVGILLLPLYFLLYGVLLFAGYVTAGMLIGEAILRKRRSSELAVWALGLLVLTVLRAIPVLGWLVAFVLVAAGFGAVSVTLWNMIQQRRSAPPRAPTPEGRTTEWTPAPT